MPLSANRMSVRIGTKRHAIWMRSSGESLDRDHADSLAVLGLLPAMRLGAPLTATGVSPRLLDGLAVAQDILLGFDRIWGTGYRKVVIDGAPRAAPSAGATGVACFFSGGVDSFYSTLKHRCEVTHLIFVHGFDIPLAETALRRAASDAARSTAHALGLRLIEVETNMRDLFESHRISWEHAHGAALAAVALLFQDVIGKIIVPATYAYGDLPPWGSHPLLDTHWSTEKTEFVHDGCEATRPEKVRRVAAHDIALENLRVCWENPDGAYNCGRCEKCVRTMINLRIVGALGRCRTLPSELDLDSVAAIPVYRPTFLQENLAAIDAMAVPDRELRAALVEAQRRHESAVARCATGGGEEPPANMPSR